MTKKVSANDDSLTDELTQSPIEESRTLIGTSTFKMSIGEYTILRIPDDVSYAVINNIGGGDVYDKTNDKILFVGDSLKTEEKEIVLFANSMPKVRVEYYK